jgi:hypothetical protein
MYEQKLFFQGFNPVSDSENLFEHYIVADYDIPALYCLGGGGDSENGSPGHFPRRNFPTKWEPLPSHPLVFKSLH